MCGLFGVVVSPGSKKMKCEKIFKDLCLLSESRGKDACGFVFQEEASIHVLKRPFKASKVVKTPEFKNLLHKAVLANALEKPFSLMGHTRMVTNGNSNEHVNNQPVMKHGMVCVHNGIVVNDALLWEEKSLEREFLVDTEIILSLVDLYVKQGESLINAVISSFACMKGANSIALTKSDFLGVILATSNGSLFTAYDERDEFVLFASEKYILEKVIAEHGLCDVFDSLKIEQLVPGKGRAITFHEGRLEKTDFSLNGGEKEFPIECGVISNRPILD
ncbi:MAG TPA: hypothetical protein PLW97_12755, partial [Synergistaceae bacterium]|nr:hypothetical protein [Synergistaceae bacterium]